MQKMSLISTGPDRGPRGPWGLEATASLS